MKTLNGMLFLCALFLISGCIPDSFTNWNLEPPSAEGAGGSGVTPPSGPGGSTTQPPTSIDYYPPGPYQYMIAPDNTTTTVDLKPVSSGGGEIVVGNITFKLAQVRDKNGVALPTVWPNSLSLDPTTGVISGRPNQFVDQNTYIISATPLGAVTPVQTQIVISMATPPGKIFYPQLNGRTLLLEISAPQNFKEGNFVTSEENAKGTVTTVDEKNKIIYIKVDCSTPPPGQTYCPTFNTGNRIDNKDGYFLEQSIVNQVVYGYTTTAGIPLAWKWVPITNISNEQPQYAISPDITVNPGVHFSTSTGQIWTDVPLTAPIPNTKYTVTVKNVLGQTSNAIFNMQILGVSDPRSPDSVEYAYKAGSRVVLELTDSTQFPVGGKITNQDGTSGTIKGILTAAAVKQLLIDIDPWSVSDFQGNQPVDNGYPYVLQATTIANKTPIIVHQIGQTFKFPPRLSGDLSPSDLDTLSWTSNPELPHLCQSIASTPTVYYKEITNEPTNPLGCTNAHGTCSVAGRNDGFTCVNTGPAGVWTTTAKYLTEYANELWFNRRTGEFGAWNPQKTFPGQTFNVSVTSLTGIVLNTTTAISFEGVPQNLGYAGDVLLEVDDDSSFDIGDMITTDGNGVGLITHKFISLPPPGSPTYTPTGKILVVKTSSGVFLEGEDIDNVYPFTYQKGEIIQAKYNDLGIQVAGAVNTFKIGEEVTSASATGIINYIQDPAYHASNTAGEPILWVRLINTKNPPSSFTTVGNPTINSVKGTAITTVTGIIGDNVTINQGGVPTTFSPGLDVSSDAGPKGGFGMVNSVDVNNVSVSVESGRFYKDTVTPASLFRYNPPDSTAAGQGSAPIIDITHNPIFYLNRFGTSGIQSVIVSPPNNGVVFSINPTLPEGLSFDTATGEINVVPPGPVAATLKNYTVVASNFLGETSFTFGLAVREVFSITDITNTNGNISGIMHKSGQGYSRFPCQITQDQIKSQATGNSRGKNINCLYDVGEGDLYSNGLVVQVNVGTNLCVYVQHLPYFFYQTQYIKTAPDPSSPTVENTGNYNNVLCGPGQPGGSISQYPAGAPQLRCTGNQSGTQCDDGAVSTIQRNYTIQGICYDSAVPAATPTDFTTCFGNPDSAGSTAGDPAAGINRSYCSNNQPVDRQTCLDANFAWNSNYAFINGGCWFIQPETDSVSCLDNYGTCTVACAPPCNRSACSAATGVWNPTGKYVANATCYSTAGVPGPDFSCGGSQLNCINGPAKDDSDFPQSQLTNRTGNYIRGYTVPVGTDPIPFTYASPSSKSFQSNMYLSNFSRQSGASPGNACTPFNGATNIYEYDMSTWFNVGYNLSPIANGTNSPFSGANGVYSIRCLDAAANIIGQINLLIREWDHDFKAKDRVDVMDWTGTPVDEGNATDPDFGNPLNAYKDWDDESIGGTCAAPTYTYPGSNL